MVKNPPNGGDIIRGCRFCGFTGEKKKNSKDYCFKIVESTKTTAKVEMITKGKKKVGFTYALNDGKYDVDFGIYFKGFSDKDASDLAMTTDISMLSTEPV